jgi:hypothetical protein
LPARAEIATPCRAVLKLAVVLLNYRRADLVEQCLLSLAPELAGRTGWRVVVVDNASGDGSAERIGRLIRERDFSGWARLVVSPRNGGFSAGNNLGISAVEAEHYVLLNSDTIVRPGALEKLLAVAEREPAIGLVGPRLEDADGTPQPSCFRNATPASELIAAAATGPVSRLLGRYRVALPVCEEPLEPPWISFACVLVRGRALREVGPLDEGFFMYFEDIDYCRRARRGGWRIRCEPSAHVVHLGGGSSRVERAIAERSRVPRYYFAARSRYFAKYYGGVPGVLAANLAWLLGRGVSLARELVGSKRAHTAEGQARDIWTAWWRPLSGPAGEQP